MARLLAVLAFIAVLVTGCTAPCPPAQSTAANVPPGFLVLSEAQPPREHPCVPLAKEETAPGTILGSMVDNVSRHASAYVERPLEYASAHQIVVSIQARDNSTVWEADVVWMCGATGLYILAAGERHPTA